MKTGRSVIWFLTLIALCLGGCATSKSLANRRGNEAELRFRLVDGDMPSPRIYWSESPRHSENMLTVEPSLPGCDDVAFYVNPSRRHQNLLGDSVLRAAPITGGEELDATRYWQHIPDRECAVLILAVDQSEASMEGLWFFTESNQVDVFAVDLPAGNPESSLGVLEPFAVVLMPVHVIVGVAALEVANVVPRGDISAPTDLAVSFEFAGGRVVETTLNWDEALDLLKGPFFIEDEYFKADRYHPFRVRNWVRAALLKLEMDFREESSKSTDEPQDWLPGRSTIVSVDGCTGHWLVQTNDGQAAEEQLSTSTEHADFIRLIWHALDAK